MKIIHTGDWHIGKIVNEFSMIDDQKYILNELIRIIDKENPDVLVIAGDVYDRSIPPVEAVELLNETLNKILIDKNVKILAIAGNHDSAERLGFGSKVLEKEGLYIEGVIGEKVKKITFNDEKGDINFYLIPYVDPAVVRRRYERQDIKNHNDVMKFYVDEIEKDMDKSSRNVLVAHGYVTLNRQEAIEENKENVYEAAHIETSESERPLSIGGTDLIDGEIFRDFDYVALGHLHGRQQVGRETMRYSGSLLKYSFSEVNHKKSVVVIDFKDKNDIEIKQEELIPKRNMRIIKGPIEELVKAAVEEENREDYIQAILTDEGEILDPIGKLRAVYPNTMMISREEKTVFNENDTSASKGYKNKSELELFKEFYDKLGKGDFSEEKEEVIKDVINEVLKESEK